MPLEFDLARVEKRIKKVEDDIRENDDLNKKSLYVLIKIYDKLDKLIETQNELINVIKDNQLKIKGLNIKEDLHSGENKDNKKVTNVGDDVDYIPNIDVKGKIRAGTKKTKISNSNQKDTLDALNKNLGD